MVHQQFLELVRDACNQEPSVPSQPSQPSAATPTNPSSQNSTCVKTNTKQQQQQGRKKKSMLKKLKAPRALRRLLSRKNKNQRRSQPQQCQASAEDASASINPCLRALRLYLQDESNFMVVHDCLLDGDDDGSHNPAAHDDTATDSDSDSDSDTDTGSDADNANNNANNNENSKDEGNPQRTIFHVIIQELWTSQTTEQVQEVLAALLPYYPDALSIPSQTTGQLPLHVACKRLASFSQVREDANATETNNNNNNNDDDDAETTQIVRFFRFLIQNSPSALLHADKEGRRPLHVLLSHAAKAPNDEAVAAQQATMSLTSSAEIEVAKFLLRQQIQHQERHICLDGMHDSLHLLLTLVPTTTNGVEPLLLQVANEMSSKSRSSAMTTLSLQNLHISKCTWNTVIAPLFSIMDKLATLDCFSVSVFNECVWVTGSQQSSAAAQEPGTAVLDVQPNAHQIKFRNGIASDSVILPSIAQLLSTKTPTLQTLILHACHLQDISALVDVLDEQHQANGLTSLRNLALQDNPALNDDSTRRLFQCVDRIAKDERTDSTKPKFRLAMGLQRVSQWSESQFVDALELYAGLPDAVVSDRNSAPTPSAKHDKMYQLLRFRQDLWLEGYHQR